MNYIQHSKILNPNKVLIDTWWNVNLSVYANMPPSISFNRYMVECEYDIINFKDGEIKRVLIDTWWNVNDERLTNRVYTLEF